MLRAIAVPALAVGAALLAGTPVLAAPAVQSGHVNAMVIRPLSLAKTADLSFGNVIAGATAGTVTINPYTDARTSTGGLVLAGGTVQAARLVGAGTPGQLVLVRWNTAAFTLTRVGGGATMQVDSLATNYVQYIFAGSDPRLVPADRVLDIRFGGRLLVGANQAAGTYEGNFPVTVDYF